MLLSAPTLAVVSNFWLPAVEPTEEVITKLLQRSGAVDGRDSFKWQITFRLPAEPRLCRADDNILINVDMTVVPLS